MNSTITNNTENEIIMKIPHLLTHEEKELVTIIRLIGSSLSCAGSLVIIVAYLYLLISVRCKKVEPNRLISNKRFKSLKMGIGHDLILFISISDMLNAIFEFLHVDMAKEVYLVSELCIVKGGAMNFFDTTTLCSVSLISFSIFLGIYDIEVDKIKYI